jgi:hypothetical protein
MLSVGGPSHRSTGLRLHWGGMLAGLSAWIPLQRPVNGDTVAARQPSTAARSAFYTLTTAAKLCALIKFPP